MSLKLRFPAVHAFMLLSKTMVAVFDGSEGTIRLLECTLKAKGNGGFELQLKNTAALIEQFNNKTTFFPTKLRITTNNINAANTRALVIQELTAVFDGRRGLANDDASVAGAPLAANGELVHNETVALLTKAHLDAYRPEWHPEVKNLTAQLSVLRVARTAKSQPLGTVPPLASATTVEGVDYFKLSTSRIVERIIAVTKKLAAQKQRRFKKHLVDPKKHGVHRHDGSLEISHLVLGYAAEISPALEYARTRASRLSIDVALKDEICAKLDTAITADTTMKSVVLATVQGICQTAWLRR
jgi:hypothetical protein